MATVNQSFVLDEVEFTLDEVVYRDNGLYGIGTIRPQEGSNAVIIPEDHLPQDPYGYDVHSAGGKPKKNAERLCHGIVAEPIHNRFLKSNDYSTWV